MKPSAQSQTIILWWSFISLLIFAFVFCGLFRMVPPPSPSLTPVEVASFHLPGAGVHNFWMDEPAQRLYAAYYNGGVVALDVSGTLSGNLSSRLISRITPGGSGQTYVWGVMLYNGSLYASGGDGSSGSGNPWS